MRKLIMFTYPVIFAGIAIFRWRAKTWERTRDFISDTTLEKEISMSLMVKQLASLSLFARRYLKLNNLQCKVELGRAGISQSEIPGLLFQANMAFEFESNHEQYPAYVISVRGWRFRFVKGIMTRQEVARFQDKKKRSGRIKVQRTREYDIYDREERKEFIRVMLGLLRSFEDRREADFSTELP
ncbi:similar to An07g07920 [Aspergillus luchuensis]|uniref:Similar to An07g07920 n=1 Tax=Aspergillus kawachii TaxID=1069201 RepID=A0A146F1M7_ASPKA|nr:similar to An07g07920 [Aspergillus luchuensis]